MRVAGDVRIVRSISTVDDPSEDFRPLRLRGGRFDEASTGRVGFPLEVIVELGRYERLLIRVARELWIKDHPGRVRAPKGFEDQLRLRLTGVEHGSVTPVLALQNPIDGALFQDADLLDRTLQVIGDALAAVVDEQPLPSAFPRAAVPALVPFGSSFRPDEACEVSRPTGPGVVYTQEGRRHLVRIVSVQDVKIDGRLVGKIGGFDANKQTFTFTDRLAGNALGAFEQIAMIEVLRRYADRDAVAPFVRISCRYSTDEHGRLAKIEDVDDVEPVIGPDDPLAGQLRPLLELARGWDGYDAPPPSEVAIEGARDFAAELAVAEVDALAVCATHEGGVLVERQIALGRWSFEVEPNGEGIVIVVSDDAEPLVIEMTSPVQAAESFNEFVG